MCVCERKKSFRDFVFFDVRRGCKTGELKTTKLYVRLEDSLVPVVGRASLWAGVGAVHSVAVGGGAAVGASL